MSYSYGVWTVVENRDLARGAEERNLMRQMMSERPVEESAARPGVSGDGLVRRGLRQWLAWGAGRLAAGRSGARYGARAEG